MPLWPFRRRGSARKRSRSGAALSDGEGTTRRAFTEPTPAITRTNSQKKQRTEPVKLQKHQRTYSYSPGRQDDIHVDRSTGRPFERRSSHRADQGSIPTGQAWERTPTLHPTRRKSSKKRRIDKERAAEVKAMSNFMPVRPATEAWRSGRPLRKETTTSRYGRSWEPASEVSLPMASSVHSSMSSDTELGSYKISTFDSLAPRPTLRYTRSARWNSSRASAPPRTATEKAPLAERAPIAEENIAPNHRIDELADNLDASDLRELMDRDRRRRERKVKRDREISEIRLAKKADAQRQRENEAREAGTPPPENMERGVAGRELVGLGLEPASAVVTSSRPRTPDADEIMVDAVDEPKAPLASFHEAGVAPTETIDTISEPTAVEPGKSADFPDVLDRRPTPEPEEHISSLSQTSKLAGLLRSKKSRSRSTLNSDKEKPTSPPPQAIEEEPELFRQESDLSTPAARFSISSFLRWGGKNRRSSAGPSSFSNTSREEMQAASAQASTLNIAQAQAQALAKLQGEDLPVGSTPEPTPVYLSRKPSAGVPKRTKSRFREDLPELPMSPPDSRGASPEHEEPVPPLPAQRMGSIGPLVIPGSHPSTEQMRQTPTSPDLVQGPSPDPHHSMSLASIDSEASWLSGGAGASRRSTLRDSIARVAQREQMRASNSEEDLIIADDEYLSNLAHKRSSGMLAGRHSTEEGRPSSDEEDFMQKDLDNDRDLDDDMGNNDINIASVDARHPVVHAHGQQRVQSRQGLLDTVSDDEADESKQGDDKKRSSRAISSTSRSGEESEVADVRRAQSIDLGRRKHARNFSAGSAKLLDLSPRQSMDAKEEKRRRRGSIPMNF